MNTSSKGALRHPAPRLNTQDFQAIAQEIKEGRGIITASALALRWGITESQAADLIRKHGNA